MSSHRPQIRYSRPARSDLVEILDYTEREWGEEQRSAYWQQLRSTIVTHAESPLLGRARYELSNGLRSYPVGSHVLYYWQTKSTLMIARVLHARQDATREDWSLDEISSEGADDPE